MNGPIKLEFEGYGDRAVFQYKRNEMTISVATTLECLTQYKLILALIEYRLTYCDREDMEQFGTLKAREGWLRILEFPKPGGKRGDN